MTDAADHLTFTGERFTPECVREIWYEHWHRYTYARSLAKDMHVLDAACGEGYGSALLAQVAAEVVGVDIDEASIAHASSRYSALPNLVYLKGDATMLPFPDARFDLVVSFETLEHLAAQEQLIAGFARVLKLDGLLVLSSPDKRTYSGLAGFRNEFHVRELYRDELLELLAPHFPYVRLYGQKLMFQSVLWTLDSQTGPTTVATTVKRDGIPADGFDYAPMYYVAVCSRRPLPATLPAISLFGDREESVYAHYNHEIGKNMAAGGRIAELESEIQRLRQRVAEPPAGSGSAVRKDWRWWRRNHPIK